MTVAEWVSTCSTVVILVVLGAVAVDRNRIKQRLSNAEGAMTGLGLDLDAMAERIAVLQSYLSTHDSWAVDATAPAALADGRVPDRWTRTTAVGSLGAARHARVGDTVAPTGRGDLRS